MTVQIAGLENENVKLLKIIFGPSFSDPANSAPQKDYFLNNRITKNVLCFFFINVSLILPTISQN